MFAVLTVSDQNDFDEGVRELEQLELGDERAVPLAQELASDADSGEDKALIANILLGVGGAAAIVTGVLAYMDLSEGGAEGSGAVEVQPGGVQIRF